ncbi:unnamed protein product [Litomosoides sigmodontis]|uniref:Acid phosphatase n=1 Tax=Litomosoides sigmodontis TaxID=42156 RepID=A0A3P6V261_LITSI|nr:unnamed protein product [Litomosoides sigmodontis]
MNVTREFVYRSLMPSILILPFLLGCFTEIWMNSIVSLNEWNTTSAINPLKGRISVRSAKPEGAELLFVHALWRHGDRGPLVIYPNNPYKESAWPNGIGELTEIGMRQIFKVGKRFYQRYINSTPPFLSKNYCNKEIYIRSTDVNRTIASAMIILAGMFPNGIAGKDYPRRSGEINWPNGWIPIPVHTVELRYDHIGNPFHHCTLAEQLESEGYKSNDFRETTMKHQDLLAYLSNVTGYEELQLDELFMDILDSLIVARFHNLTLPEWFTEVIDKQMQHLQTEILKNRFGNSKHFGSNTKLIRLRGGAILNGVVDKLRQKWTCLRDNGSKCDWYKYIKFYGLSAHDITISALLVALGVTPENIDIYAPQYGATVTFELYRHNNQPYVKFLYSNIHSEEPKSMTHLMRGCSQTSDLCPLEEFIVAQKEYLPSDIVKECHQNT